MKKQFLWYDELFNSLELVSSRVKNNLPVRVLLPCALESDTSMEQFKRILIQDFCNDFTFDWEYLGIENQNGENYKVFELYWFDYSKQDNFSEEIENKLTKEQLKFLT